MYDTQAVECFSLVLEMVGWSLTWDPAREPPVNLLSEHLTRAAALRMAPDLRPTGATLIEDIAAVTREVANATEDLKRDLQIHVSSSGGLCFVFGGNGGGHVL